MFGRPPEAPTREELLARFRRPPRDFAPISFYFWNGEPLTRERLAWQLERLAAQGVGGTIVSYVHGPDGRIDPGDPPVFSEAWWELFGWFVGESRRLGLAVGVQDYCIVNPTLEALAAEHPEMAGASLHETHAAAAAGQTVALELPPAARALSVRAFPRRGAELCAEHSVDLRDRVRGSRVEWTAPEGDWTLVAVYARREGFDPMHPESGRRVVERLYAPFERRCPEALGETLCVFFQDELDFGNRMPRWSGRLPAEFRALKGYDLEPELAALWFDLGRRTEKVRLDYADLAARLTEAHYFRPVYEWHQRHGTLWGHDNLGRGEIRESLAAYGDPFRTMRWFSAPGCDDPDLDGPRRFAGFKVNSSIAHLYGRPRVWNEGFYGSGWGVTPAQLLAALNEDFAYGATLFNPHAVYYATRGGWWEWAAPDFHFRQPYWPMTGPLWDYTARLSAVLAGGAHRCDVAVLYPSADLEAGFTGASEGYMALGQALFEAGLDFDLIDFESLERAEVENRQLAVAGERYKVLLFPGVRAVRHSSLRKALAFRRAGGAVLAYGCLPEVSEAAGRDDPELAGMVAEIFGGGVLGSPAEVLGRVGRLVERDFLCDAPGVCVLHRAGAAQDFYFVFNKNPQALEVSARFRAEGRAELWDAWTGEVGRPLEGRVEGRYQALRLRLEAKGAALVAFDRAHAAQDYPPAGSAGAHVRPLGGPWEAELTPLLDNRFGDFRLPASAGLLEPELRRFRYREGDGDHAAASADDRDWPEVSAGYGAHFWRLGPLPPDPGLERLLLGLEAINPREPLVWAGRAHPWREYVFSERHGIEADPLLTHWLSGPHGLKGRVPGEFLDLGGPAAGGEVVYLWTTVRARQPGLHLAASSRAAYAVWLGGRRVLEQGSLGAAHHPPWGIPDYRAPLRRAELAAGPGPHRLLMRLALETAQRTRGLLVASHRPVPERGAGLELPWFETALPFEHRVAGPPRVHWLRCEVPPGTRALSVAVFGALAAWLDGRPLAAAALEERPDGSTLYRLTAPRTPRETAKLALRVESRTARDRGAVLAGAAGLETGPTPLEPGPWAGLGLGRYSGGVTYRRTVRLEAVPEGRRLELSLGPIGAAARVWVNGAAAGVVLAAPWSLDITRHVRPGDNRLEILLANTLANEFADRPSPYARADQLPSGFFGEVRLVWAGPG